MMAFVCFFLGHSWKNYPKGCQGCTRCRRGWHVDMGPPPKRKINF